MHAGRFMRAAAVAVALALPVGFVAASPASAAPSTATVSVLHGIPGVVVDVYANNNLLIDNFAPGELKTVTVPGGTYALAVYADGQGPSNGTPIPGLSGSATVANGKDYTVTANLYLTGGTPAAAPKLTVFQNNRAKLKAADAKTKGRVTIRHIAAAPAVDLYVNGTVVKEDLLNGQQFQAVLNRGVYQAAAGLANAGTAGIALQSPLPVRAGFNTIVYAWGVPQSAGGAGVQVALQRVPLAK